MVKSLIWTEQSLQDIASIAAFIARDSAYYAQKMVGAILEKGESVAHFPELGRMVPEFGRDDIRERFIYSYRLIYRIEIDRIFILAVVHGRRLLDSDGL
jgi:plasmid stabilization system protein ParE